MRLSTKGRYGIKAMLDLAIHNSEGYITLKSIAQRQEISENYLEQLFASLKKADLVKSTRGSHGGYILAKSPNDITVGSILRALEGSLAPVACVDEDVQEKCTRSDTCVAKIIWEKIRDSVNDAVDSITIGSILEEYDNNSKSSDCLDYI
ncbi:MAG: Rrf2 family transcriptional regulator [Clostridiales bacterium]|jgi:Rrf2 family protein|nr:Rrf2 family transcriptional regulator [Eubacteriales bacterium]MDH7565127.1 Rrf2 family transcriptional regulator [Clostridiales bacterium]